MGVTQKFFWVVALIAAIISSITFFVAASEHYMERQVDEFLIAIAIAVIPACFARAVEGLKNTNPQPEAETVEEKSLRELKRLNEMVSNSILRASSIPKQG